MYLCTLQVCKGKKRINLIMKAKALRNLDSAQKLIDNKLYTNSVHCSYYAVFQYMKYMLANTDRNPITLEDQDTTAKGESSHEYILNQIKERINSSPKQERNFTEGVRLLKKERVDADYTTRVFTDIESIECKDRANGLITNLKTYFGNL